MSHEIIILEGVDRTGKTTVASYLESLGWNRFKDVIPPTLGDREMQLYVQGGIMGITRVLEHACQPLVIDRFHLTEWVYGSHYRGYEASYVWAVDHELADMGATLALMWDHPAAIFGRLREEGFGGVRSLAEAEVLQMQMDEAYELSAMKRFRFNLAEHTSIEEAEKSFLRLWSET